MADREKVIFNEEFRQYLENSLAKKIAKLKEIFEGCEKSTQYQLNQEFRSQCGGIKGLLADMSKDLEMVKQAKPK